MPELDARLTVCLPTSPRTPGLGPPIGMPEHLDSSRSPVAHALLTRVAERMRTALALSWMCVLLWSSAADAQRGGNTLAVSSATVLRERPGAAYRATFRIPAGARVHVERVRGGWAKVTGRRGLGWIPTRLLIRAVRPVDPRSLPVEEPTVAVDPEPVEELVPARTAPQPPAVLQEPVPLASQVRAGPPAATPLDPGDPLAGIDEVFDAARKLRGEEQRPLGPKERRLPPGVPMAYARELAPVLSEPLSGRPVAIVREGAELKVVERTPDGKWLLVEGEHADDRGWISSALVRDAGLLTPDPSAIRVGLDASMGVSAIEQMFHAETNQFLGKFALRSVAAALRLGSVLRLQVSDSVEIAADGAWRIQVARPGMRIVRDDGGNDDLGMMVQDFDAGGRIGARGRAGKGAGLYARVGYKYETIAIDAGKQARLPNEVISGPTFGGGLDVPGVGENLGVAAEVLVLAPASREQTKGLGEGKQSSTFGVGGRLALRYRVGPTWAASVGYDLWRLASEFKGGSERLPGTQGAERTTTTQLFLLGFDAML